MLIILLGISNYTHVLDQTKIKPYLDNVTFIIKQPKKRRSSTNSSSNSSWDSTLSEEITSDSKDSLTGAQSFDSNDELDQLGSIDTLRGNDEVTTDDKETTVINPSTESSFSQRIANFKLQNCISPRGKFVPRNNYIIAYEYRNSATCHRERRYCINGKLDGSYHYDTCYYTNALHQQQNNAYLSLSEIKAMKKEYGLVENQGTTSQELTKNIIWKESDDVIISGQEAWPGIVVQSTSLPDLSLWVWSSWSQKINGVISANKTLNDPDRHYLGNPTQWIRILSNGQTELNNHTLKTWSLKKQLVWVPSNVFITDHKTLTVRNSYERKLCFTPRWTLISNGQFVTAFKSDISNNGVCELETRFCFNGNLQWTYQYPHCKWKYPEIINHPWEVDTTNSSSLIRWTHQTRGPLAWVLHDLEYMSAPNEVIVSDPVVSVWVLWWSAVWSIVYHQPDEVDVGESIPEYQFIPYQTPLWDTESLIIRVDDSQNQSLSDIHSPSWLIIYHQPDEININENIPEYQYSTQ